MVESDVKNHSPAARRSIFGNLTEKIVFVTRLEKTLIFMTSSHQENGDKRYSLNFESFFQDSPAARLENVFKIKLVTFTAIFLI